MIWVPNNPVNVKEVLKLQQKPFTTFPLIGTTMNVIILHCDSTHYQLDIESTYVEKLLHTLIRVGKAISSLRSADDEE